MSAAVQIGMIWVLLCVHPLVQPAAEAPVERDLSVAAIVLSDAGQVIGGRDGTEAAPPLTRREVEVAGLVAQA